MTDEQFAKVLSVIVPGLKGRAHATNDEKRGGEEGAVELMAEHSKRAHALHNASSADYWMNCGLWVHRKMEAEAEGKEWDRGSEAADRGTLCHEAAENVIWDARADTDLGTALAVHDKLTDEERALVGVAIEAVGELLNAYGGGYEWQLFTEISFRLSHEPESEAHVDVVASRPGVLIVADYKFGEGAVSPNAHQLKIYAANALDWPVSLTASEIEDTEVVLAVIQPRLHSEAIVRRIPASELVAYRHHVEHVVASQLSKSDMRGASSISVCEWCPAKRLGCAHHEDLKRQMFVKLQKVQKPGEEKTEFIEEVVRSRTALTNIIKEMTALVVDNESRFPDWTRAHVANPRKWSPLLTEEKIGKQLIAKGAEDVYGLRSPAQVRDRNKSLAAVVEKLSVDQGHHVRLYEGAPKSTTLIEPPKRPTAKSAKLPTNKSVKKAKKK